MRGKSVFVRIDGYSVHCELMSGSEHPDRDFLRIIIESGNVRRAVKRRGETYAAIGYQDLGEGAMMSRDPSADRLNRVDRSAERARTRRGGVYHGSFWECLWAKLPQKELGGEGCKWGREEIRDCVWSTPRLKESLFREALKLKWISEPAQLNLACEALGRNHIAQPFPAVREYTSSHYYCPTTQMAQEEIYQMQYSQSAQPPGADERHIHLHQQEIDQRQVAEKKPLGLPLMKRYDRLSRRVPRLVRLGLIVLRHSINNTSKKASADRRYRPKRDWVTKKDHTRCSYWQFIQCPNHAAEGQGKKGRKPRLGSGLT